MSKLKITGKDLRAAGFPEGPVISIAMQVANKYYKHHSTGEAIQILKGVLENPAAYLNDEVFSKISISVVTSGNPRK